MENIVAGQFYDGRGISTMSSFIFNVSSSFNLTATYGLNLVRFPERKTNNSLNIQTFNLNAMVMFSTKLTASMMTQYVNTNKEIISNFRLRYNPKEGNDIYLVFNDYRRVQGRGTIPVTPRFFNETVMVKFIHTFIL